MTEVQNQKAFSTDPAIVIAVLAADRGIENIASGPLSNTLFIGSRFKGILGYTYGSGYGSLIPFTVCRLYWGI